MLTCALYYKVPRGALVPQADFRLCLLASTDVFDTRLAYPLLAKPCNIFLGGGAGCGEQG